MLDNFGGVLDRAKAFDVNADGARREGDEGAVEGVGKVELELTAGEAGLAVGTGGELDRGWIAPEAFGQQPAQRYATSGESAAMDVLDEAPTTSPLGRAEDTGFDLESRIVEPNLPYVNLHCTGTGRRRPEFPFSPRRR